MVAALRVDIICRDEGCKDDENTNRKERGPHYEASRSKDSKRESGERTRSVRSDISEYSILYKSVTRVWRFLLSLLFLNFEVSNLLN